ncbi:MAG: OadG family protein, partial [Lachnospiraceae bacterium]|nr:OadG family protein [Lachnospiraceae bacterium]
TVFVGLVIIILLCKCMSAIVMWSESRKKKEAVNVSQAASASEGEADTQAADQQEILTAVTAAIAESLGKDIRDIKVLSFRQV